ncbi:MAG: DoxX family protein [Candidatus Zambryskibacteria bacterium]|nr:DoxX family protein [Candidatus Zambryskibacteria bacterium]
MNTEIIFFIGRLLFGSYFLYNAYNHLVNVSMLTPYAESKKVPMAKMAVIVSGLLLLFGGYTIITGVRVAAGIAALVLFFVPVTFTMHAFWKEEGQTRMMEQVQFMKNLAILGAILMLLAIPTPWPMSLTY